MATSRITEGSTVVRQEELVTADMDEELVMMSLRNNNYYSLDAIGKAIWTRLQEPLVVSDLCQGLLTEFEVEPDRCLEDVLEFLNDLERAGLIHVVA